MNKNMRKELILGILLAALWLLLKILPSSGIIMTLLLIAAIALVVVGLLPDPLYEKVKTEVSKLFKNR